MKQIKPSIYSAKARPPVIPKLHRMTLQKLRMLKREKLKKQLAFQQQSSRARDFTYQAEFYQQEKIEVEHSVRISQQQNRKMNNLNAQNVPVQSTTPTMDHENITVQTTSSQNSDNQNSVQNSETHKTHENYNLHSACDSTISVNNQFHNNLIQQQADTNNYF